MKTSLTKARSYFLIVLASFLYLFVPRVSKDTKINRILVIPQLTRIGDLICTTPVFRAIKEKYPDCFLAVVVAESSHTAKLLKNNPRVDKVIILENNEYHRFWGLGHFFKRVRAEKFTYSINLAASTFGTLTSIFGRIPKRIKIVRNKRPLSETLTDWMNTGMIEYTEGEHIPTLYLKTIESLGIAVPERIYKEMFVSDVGEREAVSFLKEHSVSASDLVVGISVTAGNEIKEWGVEKFGELAKRIAEEYRAKVIFIGGPSDKKKLDRANQYAEGVGVVTADFNLEELPSLLKRLSIFISADSGPMHIAHALGVPLIDIIGPVDPHEQAPIDDPMAVVVTPPSGIKPTIFAFRAAGDPSESRKAVQMTSVNQVVEAFDKLHSKIQ